MKIFSLGWSRSYVLDSLHFPDKSEFDNFHKYIKAIIQPETKNIISGWKVLVVWVEEIVKSDQWVPCKKI